MKCAKHLIITHKKNGQAMVELVITVISFLVVLYAALQVHQISTAQLHVRQSLRASLGEEMIQRVEGGLASDKGDPENYTGGDDPFAEERVALTHWHMIALEESPDLNASISNLRYSQFDVERGGNLEKELFALKYTQRMQSVPLMDFFKEMIYRKGSFSINETLYYPELGGLK